MKKLVYLVIIVILLEWVWWRWAARVDNPASVSHEISSALQTEDKALPVVQKAAPEKRDRVKEMREIIKKANQPVVFYGRVVDQDNAPLPGVKVKLSLKRLQETFLGASADKMDYIDLTTGIDGLFILKNQKGSLLGIHSITKDGYKAPHYGHLDYWYQELVKGEKYVPQANSPEVFRMYKIFGAERLRVREFRPTPMGPEVPEDGVSAYYDILKGIKVQEGGDIKITLKRTQIGFDSRPRYDWVATIESLSGGVILSDDELMYRAPESGYKLTTSIILPKGLALKVVYFYLKIESIYARVTTTFRFPASDSKGEIDYLEAYINPTGSRNLEYDSSLEIK